MKPNENAQLAPCGNESPTAHDDDSVKSCRSPVCSARLVIFNPIPVLFSKVTVRGGAGIPTSEAPKSTQSGSGSGGATAPVETSLRPATETTTGVFEASVTIVIDASRMPPVPVGRSTTSMRQRSFGASCRGAAQVPPSANCGLSAPPSAIDCTVSVASPVFMRNNGCTGLVTFVGTRPKPTLTRLTTSICAASA